ncbi:TPA: hypothetical protein U2B44_001054 [Streptococcus suis]|nr:hypothetical protein [Streptococcus suis]
MKKTFVTLATVAALVAAAAPVATTVLANNGTFIQEDQGANATVALIGKDYAAVVAQANVANAKLNVAASETFDALQTLDFAKSLVSTFTTKLANAEDDLKTAWETAGETSGDSNDVDPSIKPQAVLNAEAAVETAKAAVETAKRQVTQAEEIVAQKQATQAAYQAELDELVAKKNELYNKFMNAGATPEQVAQAESGAEVTPAAPAGNGAAANNGGAAAPAGNGAAANNGKAAAKTVAAAKTETGAKTLPKTSAAK